MSSLELSLRHAPSGAFVFSQLSKSRFYFPGLQCILILGHKRISVLFSKANFYSAFSGKEASELIRSEAKEPYLFNVYK